MLEWQVFHSRKSIKWKKLGNNKNGDKMEFIVEIFKFILFSLMIVFISKQILVKLVRKLAEILDLSPKAVGNVAGFATSMPELLTVFFSSIQGLFGAGMYNIISSNVINFIQYIVSIVIHKNGKTIKKNKALKIELGIVIMTIVIPIVMVMLGMEANLTIVPIFLLAFAMFSYIRGNAYRIYQVRMMSQKEEDKIQEEKKWIKHKKKLAIKTSLELLFTGIALFIVGNLLGGTLETLSEVFSINEAIIGIILGFITSIPELITFMEAQKHHCKNQNEEQGVIEATGNLFTSNMLNLFIIESIGILTYVLIAR